MSNSITLGASLLFIIFWNLIIPSIAGVTIYGAGQDLNVLTWLSNIISMFGNPAVGSIWLIVNAVFGVIILRGVFSTSG